MRSIERLILCLIPFLLVGTALAVNTSIQSFQRANHALSSIGGLSTAPSKIQFAFWFVSSFFYLATNVVIGLWLFGQKHTSKVNRWAWSIFAFTNGFWAIAFFLLSRLVPLGIPLHDDKLQQVIAPNP